MKKLLFIIVAAVLCIAGAKAQQTVAVLTHEGTSKTFSGYHALQEAYADAVHGDLITLSSGTFGAITKIEKAVKIRGAGMEMDTIYHTSSTTLVGDMTLAIADGGNHNFRLEGVYHGNGIYYMKSQVKPEFVKCRLNFITRGSYDELGSSYFGTVKDFMLYHCKVTGYLLCGENCSFTAINSYIKAPRCMNDTTSIFDFMYCVITGGENSSAIDLRSSNLYGCVIAPQSTHWNYYSINDKTALNMCLLKQYDSSTPPDTSKNSYQFYGKFLEAFKTFNGIYSCNPDAEDFELLPVYNSLYGMYGGSFPYSPRVTGPHIQSMEVAPRSTEEGKLNVKIKVENTTD